MKFINHFIVCSIIFILSFFLSFYFLFTDSFCLAQESFLLDQSAFEVLEGGASGQNGAYTESSSFGINADPNMIVFGLDNIITDINTKLYNKYGWDLETASWVVEDSMTQAVKDQVYHNLALGAVIGQGFMLYESSAINALTGAKDYILGKVDETTGKISQVFNNAYTYVSDSFINKFSSIKDDLIQDNAILNFSQSNHFLYGSSFHFIVQGLNTVSFTLNFSEPVVICSKNSSTSNKDLSIFTSSSLGSSISCTGVVVIGSNNPKIIDYAFASTSSPGPDVVIDGVTYHCGTLVVHNTDSTTNIVQSDIKYGSNSDTSSFLGSNGLDFSSSYNSSNYEDIKSLLNELKGTWVTTDDLRQINEKLNELTLGNISLDGQNNTIINTDSQSLAELSTLIQSILQQNADISLALDELNNNSGGGSGSDDDDDPPTQIPEVYWPSFFSDLLPDEMFTMFKPIFDIVGTSYSMYGLWILIPSILIFVLVLYILVSLF